MTGQPAYTDADVQAAAKAIARRSLDGESQFTDLARAALDAVVPGIVARAKAEALREMASDIDSSDPEGDEWCTNDLRDRADEIEAGR